MPEPTGNQQEALQDYQPGVCPWHVTERRGGIGRLTERREGVGRCLGAAVWTEEIGAWCCSRISWKVKLLRAAATNIAHHGAAMVL